MTVLKAISRRICALRACTPAKCGDAYVQPSNGETCDDGQFNAAMPGYNECSTSCVRESFCGDGVVQIEAGEECEPGGGGDESKLRRDVQTFAAARVRHQRRVLGEHGRPRGRRQTLQPGRRAAARDHGYVSGVADGRRPEPRGSVSGVRGTGGLELHEHVGGAARKELRGAGRDGARAAGGVHGSGGRVAHEFVWTGITKDGVAAGGDCAQWTSEAGKAALIGYTGYLPNVGPDALKWKLERQWTDKGVKKYCDKKHTPSTAFRSPTNSLSSPRIFPMLAPRLHLTAWLGLTALLGACNIDTLTQDFLDKYTRDTDTSSGSGSSSDADTSSSTYSATRPGRAGHRARRGRVGGGTGEQRPGRHDDRRGRHDDRRVEHDGRTGRGVRQQDRRGGRGVRRPGGHALPQVLP
jgi:hypothetical protein